MSPCCSLFLTLAKTATGCIKFLISHISHDNASVIVDSLLLIVISVSNFYLYRVNKKTADAAQRTIGLSYYSEIQAAFKDSVMDVDGDDYDHLVSFTLSANIPTEILSVNGKTDEGESREIVRSDLIKVRKYMPGYVSVGLKDADIENTVNLFVSYEDAASGDRLTIKSRHFIGLEDNKICATWLSDKFENK